MKCVRFYRRNYSFLKRYATATLVKSKADTSNERFSRETKLTILNELFYVHVYICSIWCFLLFCGFYSPQRIISVIKRTQRLRWKKRIETERRKLISRRDVLFHFLLYLLRSSSYELMNARPFYFTARFQFRLSFCSLLLELFFLFSFVY